jgi:filamentous hemagglutinin
MNASGDASSTTKAGISHADITITDEAKQRELTGKDAATTVSELNRDVSSDKDTSNNLNPIFDPDKIQANFDIVSAFSRETGTFLNNRAQETTNAKKALDEELAKPKDQQDASKIAQLNQVIQNNATWEMGGTGRRLLTAITAAASGNVTGSGAQFIQSATVNYLQSLGAEQVKHLVDSFQGTTAEKETARAALQGLLACGGAAVQGASCGSAASGAAASVVLNNLVSSLTGKKAEEMTAEEKQAQENLVTSLITGITSEAGGDAAVANAAARIETENNMLLEEMMTTESATLAIGGAAGNSGKEKENKDFERSASEAGENIKAGVEKTLASSWSSIIGWIVSASEENSDTSNDTSGSLIDDKTRQHILDGDKNSGGHRSGTGIPGKSEFPPDWSDDEIIGKISDIVTDPASTRSPGFKDRTVVTGTRDGIDIAVVVSRDGKVVTAFPTNTPRNPMP